SIAADHVACAQPLPPGARTSPPRPPLSASTRMSRRRFSGNGMISADGLRSGVQIGYVMEANQDFEISDPTPRRPVAGVFLADVSEGAHQVSSPCVAMSVGRSRKRDLAHSSAGPGACNGRLPHHESTGGPRLIAGEQSLLNVDSLMGKPL